MRVYGAFRRDGRLAKLSRTQGTHWFTHVGQGILHEVRQPRLPPVLGGSANLISSEVCSCLGNPSVDFFSTFRAAALLVFVCRPPIARVPTLTLLMYQNLTPRVPGPQGLDLFAWWLPAIRFLCFLAFWPSAGFPFDPLKKSNFQRGI